LSGFLAIFLLQRFFPYHHHDVSDEAPERRGTKPDETPTLAEQSASHLSWIATTIGMTLHSLVGGMALAAAVSADAGGLSGWMGLGTALVIILHKPFDALAVSTVMTAGRCPIASRHLILHRGRLQADTRIALRRQCGNRAGGRQVAQPERFRLVVRHHLTGFWHR
jgi:zinc and cadmium transporter